MLYVLRHCQTEWNKLNKIQGRADVPLNDEGRRQAERAFEKLKGINFEAAYSSPSKRALETIEIACGITPIKDERLYERNFGKMEGMNKYDVNFPKVWDLNYLTDCGVESLEDMKKRVFSFLDEIKKEKDKTIIVCAHGGTNMVIAHYFFKNPKSGNLYEYLIKNGEIAVYDFDREYEEGQVPDLL